MKSLMQAMIDVGARLPLTDMKVKQRFERAYEIARCLLTTNGGYEVKEITPGNYDMHRVSSSLLEDNGVHYTVNRERCTCPDYETARAGLCKHRMAIMLIEDVKS